jgi:hypothetical protein
MHKNNLIFTLLKKQNNLCSNNIADTMQPHYIIIVAPVTATKHAVATSSSACRVSACSHPKVRTVQDCESLFTVFPLTIDHFESVRVRVRKLKHTVNKVSSLRDLAGFAFVRSSVRVFARSPSVIAGSDPQSPCTMGVSLRSLRSLRIFLCVLCVQLFLFHEEACRDCSQSPQI